MQDAVAFVLALAAAGALLAGGLSPLFPRLRPAFGGNPRANLALWAGLVLVLGLGAGMAVANP